MKKALLLVAIISFTNLTFAQKVNLGARLGFTNALLVESYNGSTVTNEGGYNNVDLALYADIKFNKLTIQPGLAYFLKGGGYGSYSLAASQGSTYLVNQYLRFYYIEVPVNALYNIPIKAGKFFMGGGPYVAMAVAAKVDYFVTTINAGTTGTVNAQKSTSDLTFGSGANDFQRLDYGLNLLGGFRFNKGVELGLAYGIGLQNLSNQPNFTVRNATGSITLGYFFK